MPFIVDDDNPHAGKAGETIRQSALTWSDFLNSIQVMQSFAQMGRFEQAEAERERLHVLVDTYLDQFMSAAKLLRGEQK